MRPANEFLDALSFFPTDVQVGEDGVAQVDGRAEPASGREGFDESDGSKHREALALTVAFLLRHGRRCGRRSL